MLDSAIILADTRYFMLTTLAIIFLFGLCLGAICKKCKLPSLIGFIITGMMISPYALNLIDASILNISADLRQIALVIILTRAGLSLDIKDLKKVGRPAILMCFVPACFEMLATVLFAPKLLNISILDAAILGSVIAAVSPAVIVPRMIHLMEEDYGKSHSIPQLILAGASVDDIFVIVVFSAFTTLATTGNISAVTFIEIPISIVTGILFGFFTGYLLIQFFKHFHMRDSMKILIILSISFLMIELEKQVKGLISFSGLLAIMSIGLIMKQKYEALAIRLSSKYNKLWVGAEILLFVLVGATVNIEYALQAGIMSILLLFGTLLFRMLGVYCCLIKTKLTPKEKIFCMIAYMPKATVQAAIGAIPLSMGLSCGNIVLTVAVLSILITAPIGALGIDMFYQKLLTQK